jgi:hypothetical protein
VVLKRLLALTAALMATVLAAVPTAAAQNGYVVVHPSAMHGWAFFNDNHKAGSGQMVFGPTGQPLGVGSAELTLTTSSDGYTLTTHNHDLTKVSSIISLDYSTYTRNTHAIALQLTVYNTTDPLALGYHRLVYEPGVSQGNPAVVSGAWQRWAPTAPTARWWMTHPPTTGVCSQATPCPWPTLKAMFPTTTLRGDPEGSVHLKAGSGWSMDPTTPPNKYNVDAFVFVAASPFAGVLYDFEPERAGSGGGGGEGE